MQKTLYILLSCVLLASCSKSKCWQCDVVSAGTEFRETVCGKTQKDIQDLMDNPQETKNKQGEVIYITTYSNCIED